MSALTALARAYAVKARRAQPMTTVRHIHIEDHPMVCVPLSLAGEVIAPLAALVGTDRGHPELLIVPQPRDRVLRLEFAHELAMRILHYIATCRHATTGPTIGTAAQLWVPNRGGVEFLRLLGRSTRFRSTTGEYPAPIPVPDLGRWLTFYAERADHPGSSLLVAATDALARHWASGQSDLEDANLAALLGWIEPPPDSDGARAALDAADPLIWPPAGPATDPTFDREVLAPSIAEYDRATTRRERLVATTRLETALREQLLPTWQLVWRGIDCLRTLAPGAHVTARWGRDVKEFNKFGDRVAKRERPQPKRDSAVAAARRLNELERAQAEYDAQRAFDDLLVMAEYRLSGEAFAGTVSAVDLQNPAGTGRRSPKPVITIHTTDPVRLTADEATELVDQQRPQQKASITAIRSHSDGTAISLELSRGMGRGKTPLPGSVPAVGELVCYSRLSDRYTPTGKFPDRSDTPWTHGGPPDEPLPAAQDANEEWS
ncbi:hypothetical protein [Nocardia sp. NPDC047038]|uniref:hypothetical protein n=1 Tax=Nocardia sp. NPDC047038 TaxID=3154338 RepID=UPI0033C7035F